jgi:glycosyltransferase involved in cell wall biosynthesis
MMKIVLSNYRYHVTGGPERYLFSIKKLLESEGHSVFPFSVKSSRNIKTEYEKYFLSPIDRMDSDFFEEYRRNARTFFKVMSRQFFSIEGYRKAKDFCLRFRPDLVYCFHFLNKMSPSVLDGFKSAGIPIVARLSDFGLICPNGHFLSGGQICEKCLGGAFYNAAFERCIKNSFSAGLVKALAWYFHRIAGSINRINAFVCPSEFLKEKLIEAGYPEKKVHHVPTFINLKNIKPSNTHEGFFLYFGRVNLEKGVDILLDAFERLAKRRKLQGFRLVIIGDTKTRGLLKLNKKAFAINDVEFREFMGRNELYSIVKRASFVVIPSRWYDNLPNVALESYAHGKAVIAPNHGSFPHFVKDGLTGVLFESRSVQSLEEKLEWALKHVGVMLEMGKEARRYVEKYFSPEGHLEKLMSVFESVGSIKRSRV